MTDQQVRLGGPRVLVVDCRDSFVYTIVDYLASLGAAVTIRQADDIAVDELEAGDFDGVLLSPGPGAPAQAATSHAVIDRFAGVVPILGVCLGHQVIAEHYGGMVERAPQLRHGETSRIHHDGTGVFTGLDTPFTATGITRWRYPRPTCPSACGLPLAPIPGSSWASHIGNFPSRGSSSTPRRF